MAREFNISTQYQLNNNLDLQSNNNMGIKEAKTNFIGLKITDTDLKKLAALRDGKSVAYTIRQLIRDTPVVSR